MRPLQLIAAGLAGIALACTPAADRAEGARAEVERALAGGDRPGALRAIEALEAALPETAEAQLELARLRVRAGDAPAAAWFLEAALRRHPQRNDLRLALAETALRLGDPGEALRRTAEIGPDAPEHADALLVRAQAELQRGDRARALETLAEVERRHPHRPEAGLVKLMTLLSEGRQEEALAALARLRATASDTSLRRSLDLLLAQLQAANGETEAAIQELEALLAEDPHDLLPWQSLAPLLVATQRGDEAASRLARAVDAGTLPPTALLLLARVQAALGREAAVPQTLARFADASDTPDAVVPLVDWHAARREDAAALDAIERALARRGDEPLLLRLDAEALLAAERLADARGVIQRHRAAAGPDDPEARYLAARLRLAEGDAAAAADALRALAPALDTAPLQLWLGRALEESGDATGALRRYGLAHQRDPLWTPPLHALYRLAARRAQWPQAAEAALALVRIAPGVPAHWSLLGDALEALGDPAGAETLARRCATLFPEHALPPLLLARALRAQGHTEESLAQLDVALARAQASPGALDPSRIAAERALTLAAAGRLDEAMTGVERALARQPDDAALQAALAALRFQQGDAEGGRQASERALALDPTNPRPLRLLCRFEASRGGADAARDACERYLRMRPDDADVHFMRGVVLARLGDEDEAIAAYREAAALDPRDARPRNNLALLLGARGDLDGALAAAQEAYRLAEDDPRVAETLASLYRQRGFPARAIALLEQAHARSPEHAALTAALADAYRGAGRDGDADALLAGARDAGHAARVEEAPVAPR